MKIAIITLPLHTNYGGLLQAYALQTVLERMGHEVVVIDQKTFSLGIHIPLSRVIDRMRRRWRDHEDCYLLYERKLKQLTPVIRQHTDRFITAYIHRQRLWSPTDIKEGQFDGFVVGSDQVWRPVFTPKIAHAYLDFTEGWSVRRVAYAPSFGVDYQEYTSSQIEACKKAIARFDGISVREASGVDLCHSYFGVEASWVLDPTLLLHRGDYLELIEKSGVGKSHGTLFCYILDQSPDVDSVVREVEERKHLVPFALNAFSGNKRVPVELRIQPPVESWLRAFMDAEYVLTDSFHACVFSILFHRPFMVLPNKNRGLSRISSLLRIFGLEDRLLSNHNPAELMNSEINWTSVDERLDIWRKKSQTFLVEALG